MCRRARINLGSPSNRAAWVNKLRQRQCLRVVVIGGTVTCGRTTMPDRGGEEGKTDNDRDEAWPHLLQEYLNSHHPCPGSHVVLNECVEWKGTAYWVYADLSKSLTGADLLLVDTAVHDIYDEVVDPIANEFARNFVVPANNIQRWTEVLIQKMLLLHTGLSMAWVTVSWRDSQLKRNVEGHLVSERDQAPVLQYYDIDHLSLLSALRPVHTQAFRQWAAETLFTDDKWHLSRLGHKMVAQVIGSFVDEEATRPPSAPDRVHLPTPSDDGFLDPPRPVYVTQEDVEAIIMKPFYSVVFANPVEESGAALSFGVDAKGGIVFGELLPPRGWSLLEDVPGQQGMITEGQQDPAPLVVTFLATRPQFQVLVGALHSNVSGTIEFRVKNTQTGLNLRTGYWDCLSQQSKASEQPHLIRYRRGADEGTEYTLELHVRRGKRPVSRIKLFWITVK